MFTALSTALGVDVCDAPGVSTLLSVSTGAELSKALDASAVLVPAIGALSTALALGASSADELALGVSAVMVVSAALGLAIGELSTGLALGASSTNELALGVSAGAVEVGFSTASALSEALGLDVSTGLL